MVVWDFDMAGQHDSSHGRRKLLALEVVRKQRNPDGEACMAKGPKVLFKDMLPRTLLPSTSPAL